MIILSYIVALDYGFAPNPYYGVMTLTTCKSPIRVNASKILEQHKDGFWIIGTGSHTVRTPHGSYKDYSGKMVFAMKISKVMTLKEYDRYCTPIESNLHNKIPKRTGDFSRMVGDCIYRFPLNGEEPLQRPGLHCSDDIEDDLKGKYSLHSDEFFYFGLNAITLPETFQSLLMTGQGYKKIEESLVISSFKTWLYSIGYEKNTTNGKPQLMHLVSQKFK